MSAPFIHCTAGEIASLERYLVSRAAWQWLQGNHCDGYGSERPFRDDVASSVNGRELRVAPRWHSVGRAYRPDTDWQCWLVKADGSREPFQPSRDFQSRRRAVAGNAGEDYVARLAKYGTDASMADGTV